MNPPSDTTPTPPSESPGVRMGMDEDSPANWVEALMALIASRYTLIRIEARESAKSGLTRVLGLVAAAFCLFFAWFLLLVGGVGAIAAATGCPWHWVAVAAAAIHLLAAILITIACKKSTSPAFPLTIAEFQKDREWIENIQNRRKSNG